MIISIPTIGWSGTGSGSRIPTFGFGAPAIPAGANDEIPDPKRARLDLSSDIPDPLRARFAVDDDIPDPDRARIAPDSDIPDPDRARWRLYS